MSLLTNVTCLLTGIKDVDLKIFSELDDISLLNFCRQNESNEYIKKLCFDETFWRNRTLKKYGVLKKNPTRSWRNFYLNITYYSDKYNPNKAIYDLAEGGSKNLDLINFFIDKGGDSWIWNMSMMYAAKSGDMDLVQFFIDKGAKKWDFGLRGAAEGKHMDLVNFFIDKGVDEWNNGIRGAAEGGHMDLVQFFIDKGANDWKWGMFYAKKGGYNDLVNFFQNKIDEEKGTLIF